LHELRHASPRSLAPKAGGRSDGACPEEEKYYEKKLLQQKKLPNIFPEYNFVKAFTTEVS